MNKTRLPLLFPGLLVAMAAERPLTAQANPPTVTATRSIVDATIEDGASSTEIRQTFRNHGAHDAEATWLLPLPADAVADRFTMTVAGLEIPSEVLDAGRARAIYEQIVRQRRDPGLLEYVGQGLLRARVFPIPAQGEVEVKLRLRQVLQPVNGLYEWRFPLRALRAAEVPAGTLGVAVTIRSQTPLRTVFSNQVDAEILRKGDGEARIGLELPANAPTDKELRLYYTLARAEFGLHVLTSRHAGDAGYFAMMIAPPRDVAASKLPRRCVQFVLDTSGSMSGAKIAQAKAALRAFVGSLRPDDLFQIVTFATVAQAFFEAPRPATTEAVAAAMARIDGVQATGGTNIGEALQLALAADLPAGDDGGALLQQIVFVTDGEPTIGMTSVPELLLACRKQDRHGARMFVFGVGDQVNTLLLDDLAAQHRGARDYVAAQENLEVKTAALCKKLAQPVFSDVEVRCEGLEESAVHPARVRDLFAGENLFLVGRYRGTGSKLVRVHGKLGGKAQQYVFEAGFPAVDDRHDFVRTLWARQQIAALLDGIRRNGANPELVAEVKKLATQYAIATPYTSHLILEEGARLGGTRWGDLGPRGPATPGPQGPSTGGPRTGGGAPTPEEQEARRRLAGGSWPTTGAEAVRDSRAVQTGSDEFWLGTRKTPSDRLSAAARQTLRTVGARTFVQAGEFCVEVGLPAEWRKQGRRIEAFSDAWFALGDDQPELRAVLALATKVAFRLGAEIVFVE